MSRLWWWSTLYKDVMEWCRNCPECSIVTGAGRNQAPLLHPIPVERPFQILGVDIMELPTTVQGNHYVVVFQDFFTKWPFVFPTPDQKAIRIARLLAEEVVPVIGVPEALLSDRGTNLLAHVMLDVCSLLGITKLNTTAYHPQCNVMVNVCIVLSRPCCESMQQSLDCSGIGTCLVCYGHIATHLMNPLKRNLLS